MNRERDSSQDDLNRLEPEDTGYRQRPRPQSQRSRAARDDQRRQSRSRSEQPGTGEYRHRRPAPSRDTSQDAPYQSGGRQPVRRDPRGPLPPRSDRSRGNDPPDTRSRQTRDFRQEQENSYRRAQPGSTESPITRQSRDPGQRSRAPRPPLDAQEYVDERSSRTPVRREFDPREDEYDEYVEYAQYGDYPQRVRRSGSRAIPQPPQRRQTKRRGPWSTLLIGCIGGIVTVALLLGIGAFILLRVFQVSVPGLGIGTSTYTDKQQTLSLGITSNITQLQVQNNVGNISISDGTQPGGTLSYVKKTRASSSSDAATKFASMQVKLQPGNSTGCPKESCLIVSVTAPTTNPGSIDMVIVLPPQNPTPQFNLSSKTQTGDISVENFNGLLTLTVDTGNVNVTGGLLDAGSCLQDRIGSITFAGTLETANRPAINPCVGNAPSTDSTQPWYSFKTGTGNVNVTLNALSAQVNLNATIYNNGQITSQYPISIQTSNGSPSYNGPLLPGTRPVAQLLISTDTGNIALHQT